MIELDREIKISSQFRVVIVPSKHSPTSLPPQASVHNINTSMNELDISSVINRVTNSMTFQTMSTTPSKSDNTEGIIIACANKECSYNWRFTGHAKFYACCPRCRRQNRIPHSKINQNKVPLQHQGSRHDAEANTSIASPNHASTRTMEDNTTCTTK